jgi:hypothetical protein
VLSVTGTGRLRSNTVFTTCAEMNHSIAQTIAVQRTYSDYDIMDQTAWPQTL